ncbi:MAG TPA: T9SS type A sorting domain-containing protein, partial [Candidatus Kapabacteria bacterium]|nr:T9SS type A sorting domain-containing protein [Candidatus Kapabacteria bacterium]
EIMKNAKLQSSEALTKMFAARREEAPLLSTPEIEKLLARRAMLPKPSRNILRRSIMTLTGLTGIGAIIYFALFNGPNPSNTNHISYRKYETNESHLTIPKTSTARAESTAHQQTIKQARKNDERGPWSAGNDLYYADLSREQLKWLGIVVQGDSVFNYSQVSKNQIVLTAHSVREVDQVPQGVHVPGFYPVLTTFSNGHGAFYRIEKGLSSEWGMTDHDDSSEEIAEKPIREWLAKPGIPGLYAYRLMETTCVVSDANNPHGVETDTVHIQIGKNLPHPILKPLTAASLRNMPDSVKNALIQLAHFYEGSNVPMPSIEWPKNLTIKVDTVTASDLIEKLDREQNSQFKQHLESIFAHINELIPVIVRMTPGTGEPSKEDFIFWYEPSEELFNALPAAQAAVFRARLSQHPQCLSMPNDVLTSAEITYCVAEPREVQVTVQDLTGKLLMIMSQLATAGDNVLQFTTETLPSGMYIVTVLDGTERSRRLWVENAHPKNYRDVKFREDAPHAPDQTLFMNGDTHESTIEKEIAEPHPGLLSIPSLELDAPGLAKIGVECNNELAGYYRIGASSKAVNYMGFLRNGHGVKFNTFDRDSIKNITAPSFRPIFVTDDDGRGLQSPSGDSVEQVTAFKEIDQLIPILLRADNTSDSVGGKDLIFWYKPTPEFLAALPDSARQAAMAMTSGTIGNGNGGSRASLEMEHGVIQNAIAYPNPSRGIVNVRVTLGEPRMLTLTIRNLLGQEAESSVQVNAEGSIVQKMDFSKLQDGIYLLDITSDAGERWVQRIVIVH